MEDKVQKDIKTIEIQKEQNPIARRNAKDSVFCNLFKDKKYLLQLYQALHPEDTKTTEADLTDITIRNVLTDGLYNDLGFRNGNKVMILTEAQSTWSANILIRAFMYLAQTYQNYLDDIRANLYGSKKVCLPEPELYVVFTGKRKNQPDVLSLSDEFFKGKECAIQVKVKMLYGGNGKDIISQYVAFAKVYDEQIRLHGQTREAVAETIRICKDQDVLKEYLEASEKEVISIMMTLFDEQHIMKTYVAEKVQEAVEAAVEETEEAAKEAAAAKEKRSAQKLYQMGVSIENIAEASEVSEEVVKQWLGL